MAGSSNRDEIAALRKRAEAEQLSQTRETRQRDAKGMNRKRHQFRENEIGCCVHSSEEGDIFTAHHEWATSSTFGAAQWLLGNF